MTNEDAPEPELVQVGQTGRAHGIDGEIRIFTADPHWEYFDEGHSLFLESRGGPDEYTIETWRVAEDFAIVQLESVEDRTAAERLTNLDVCVPAEVLPDLEEREYYHYDLEGRDVFVEAGEASPEETARRIGTVEGLFETGANDVLVVRLEEGDELYVPMFEGAIADIEPDADRILLRPLESWAPDGTDI